MPQSFVDDLLPELSRLRPQLVIHGAHNPGPGLAARVAGIPALCHGTGRVRSDDDELMVLSGDVLREYAAELGVDLPSAHKTYLGNAYLDICPSSLQNPEFREHAHNRIPLRPVPFNPPAKLPAWVRERTGDRLLVYLTMGTESDSVELLRQALDGPAKARLIGSGCEPSGECHMTGGSLAEWFDVVLHQREVTPTRPCIVDDRVGEHRPSDDSCRWSRDETP
jgi:hypothetical protein